MQTKSAANKIQIHLVSSKEKFDQIPADKLENKEIIEIEDSLDQLSIQYSRIIPKFEKVSIDLPRKKCNMSKGYHKYSQQTLCRSLELQDSDRHFVKCYTKKFQVHKFSFLTNELLRSMYIFLDEQGEKFDIDKNQWMTCFYENGNFIEREMFEFYKINEKEKFKELQRLVYQKWMSKNKLFKNNLIECGFFKGRPSLNPEFSIELRSRDQISENTFQQVEYELMNYRNQQLAFNNLLKMISNDDRSSKEDIEKAINSRQQGQLYKSTKYLLKTLKQSEEHLSLMSDDLNWYIKTTYDKKTAEFESIFKIEETNFSSDSP